MSSFMTPSIYLILPNEEVKYLLDKYSNNIQYNSNIGIYAYCHPNDDVVNEIPEEILKYAIKPLDIDDDEVDKIKDKISSLRKYPYNYYGYHKMKWFCNEQDYYLLCSF